MKKTAIVTGGSRGIGFAIAHQLGKDGFNVVVMARNAKESNIDNLTKLEKNGIDYLYVSGSIDRAADRQNAVEEAVKKYGRIDVLVNNAGVAPSVRNDLLDMTEESFDRVVGINTKGTLFMSQLVARQMLKQDIPGKKRGTIVNISSCSSVVSSTNRGEYCISKAGISMITTLFADRLAQDSIYVYEIRPGVIATDMTAGVQEKYDKLVEEGVFPIARWGLPEDIGNAVSAFCSDKFLYTTGNYIDVDGGFHIRRL